MKLRGPWLALAPLLLVGGCAVHPTIPDPTTLKVPTKSIIVTDGTVNTPHDILGPVEAVLGGPEKPELPGAAEAARQHLRNAAYTKFGDRLDALIAVRTSPVTPRGSSGLFGGPRAVRAEGVAIAFRPPVALESTDERSFTEAVNLVTEAIVRQLEALPPFLTGAEAALHRRRVVIDSMLDAASGQQTVATRQLEQQVADRLRTYPQVELLPFQIPTLGQADYLLTGTMRRLDGKPTEHVFQIVLTVTDLKSGTIVARASSWARDDTLDTSPTPYYRDSPFIVKDAVVDGYIRTTEAVPGHQADPQYFERVAAATLISDALLAYNAERYEDALTLYHSAAATPAGDQLRVLNGIYLATWKLGRASEAEAAFGKVVALGLRNNTLGVKFLFEPGTTTFWSDPKVSGPYSIWLRQIARQAAAAKVCLNVVGHASLTGSEQYNDRLSQQRATYIKQRLDAEAADLASRTRAIGMGFREPLVGTGTDDARDALDRRVEFKVTGC